MKTSAHYIEEIKRKHGLPSDYAASKLLGITRSSISRLQHGEDSFGDDTALRVAELLDLDPQEVMIAAHAQRAKDARTRSVWERLARQCGYAAGVAALAISAGIAPAPAQAATASQPVTMCIMLRTRRMLAAIRDAFGNGRRTGFDRRRHPRILPFDGHPLPLAP